MSIPNPGDQAPAFQGRSQSGDLIKLSDFAGKKLILYFYPKDDTPGCTAEACNFRDHYQDLLDRGFAVLGVSADNQAKHQKFIDKYQLPFPLIADEDKQIIQAYGAWGPKKFMGREYEGIHRFTFVIDEAGKVAQVYQKVKTKEATEQILADFPA